MYLLKINNETEIVSWNYDSLPIKIWSKIIYKLNGDSLISLDTLNSQEGFYLRDFVQFPDKDLAYFVEEEYKDFKGTNNFNISFFDYSKDSFVIRRINTMDTSVFKNFSVDPFSFQRHNEIYVCNQWDYDPIEDKIRRYAVDRNMDRTEVSYNDAKNIYAFGASGYQGIEYGAEYNNTSWFTIDRIQSGDLLNRFKLKDNNECIAFFILHGSGHCAGITHEPCEGEMGYMSDGWALQTMLGTKNICSGGGDNALTTVQRFDSIEDLIRSTEDFVGHTIYFENIGFKFIEKSVLNSIRYKYDLQN